MRNIIYFLCAVVVFFLFIVHLGTVYAKEALPNNKFGIHLAQPHLNDIQSSASLLNKNGGDWGYVTLVMQENDRNREKWQEIFDLMRELHLIPIIRIATVPQGAKWKRPELSDIEPWVDFLNSLNWVIKKRYIVLYNEPNHAVEWGGVIDVPHYASVTMSFAKALKVKNDDYFVMLSGFDASAPNSLPDFMGEEAFLQAFFLHVSPDNFNKLFSGWASHSYPNPGFSGSPYATGRGSIQTYQWELVLLRNLGVSDLPVFITETGWVRQVQNSNFKTQNTHEDFIANNYQSAFEQIWLPDSRVQAVTPFVLDYQGDPFLGFSWKLLGSEEYYPQYEVVASLQKVKGEPEQIEGGQILYDFPKELVAFSTYHFKLNLKNSGQGFWDRSGGYEMVLDSNPGLTHVFTEISKIKPSQEEQIHLFLKTGSPSQPKKTTPLLSKNGNTILSGKLWEFTVLPLPYIDFKVQLFPKIKTKGDDFEVQIFDGDEQLVIKKKGIRFDKMGKIPDIQNIAIGRKYRVVLLKPYYLPRQTYVIFRTGQNNIMFKRMLPLDFNKDGTFSLGDISYLVQHFSLLDLLFPTGF